MARLRRRVLHFLLQQVPANLAFPRLIMVIAERAVLDIVLAALLSGQPAAHDGDLFGPMLHG